MPFGFHARKSSDLTKSDSSWVGSRTLLKSFLVSLLSITKLWEGYFANSFSSASGRRLPPTSFSRSPVLLPNPHCPRVFSKTHWIDLVIDRIKQTHSELCGNF